MASSVSVSASSCSRLSAMWTRVTTAKIMVTLPGGFKIVIEDGGSDEEFDISGSGRGWYLTRKQIAVTEYLLECLEKDPSKDPLSDIFEHSTVIKTNTYTV